LKKSVTKLSKLTKKERFVFGYFACFVFFVALIFR